MCFRIIRMAFFQIRNKIGVNGFAAMRTKQGFVDPPHGENAKINRRSLRFHVCQVFL